MKRRFLLALAVSACIATTEGQDGIDKPSHHARRWHWVDLLSAAEQAKYRAARKAAMQDPVVRAAAEKRRQADQEFREARDAAILKADPSLKPLLDKLRQLRKHAEF